MRHFVWEANARPKEEKKKKKIYKIESVLNIRVVGQIVFGNMKDLWTQNVVARI